MRRPDSHVQVWTPGDRDIRAERVFAAPVERVWRALTEPALVAQWWGRGNELDVEHMDVKGGGRWRYLEHAPDGVHGFGGHYQEVIPCRRIVRTFEWDGMPGAVHVETTELEAIDHSTTRVVTTAHFHTTEERDAMAATDMADGLAQSYDVLDRVLAELAT